MGAILYRSYFGTTQRVAIGKKSTNSKPPKFELTRAATIAFVDSRSSRNAVKHNNYSMMVKI
jgi:hypothetical protein